MTATAANWSTPASTSITRHGITTCSSSRLDHHRYHPIRPSTEGTNPMTSEPQTVTLPGGERVPALGQGTWHMGEDRRRIAEEAAAVRLGIELGITLIDTAGMYGGGGAVEMGGRVADWA